MHTIVTVLPIDLNVHKVGKNVWQSRLRCPVNNPSDHDPNFQRRRPATATTTFHSSIDDWLSCHFIPPLASLEDFRRL